MENRQDYYREIFEVLHQQTMSMFSQDIPRHTPQRCALGLGLTSALPHTIY